MRTILLLLATIGIGLNLSAQTSPFAGTWKWESGNQIFYVYIQSKMLTTGKKVLRVDYKMVTVNNTVETEVYSSRIDGLYFGAGAIMAEYESHASGMLQDCTHPNTTDCYDGLITLVVVPVTGMQPVGTPPKLHWKIRKHSDYMQGTTTPNPPSGFNLPTNIMLTKVQEL